MRNMLVAIPVRWYQRIVDVFWFSLCLALFMVLGPFAAPIAICFMFSKHIRDEKMQEPDSASETHPSYQ